MVVGPREENSRTQGRLPLQPRQEQSDGGYADACVVVGEGTSLTLAVPVFLPQRPHPPGKARPLLQLRVGAFGRDMSGLWKSARQCVQRKERERGTTLGY